MSVTPQIELQLGERRNSAVRVNARIWLQNETVDASPARKYHRYQNSTAACDTGTTKPNTARRFDTLNRQVLTSTVSTAETTEDLSNGSS